MAVTDATALKRYRFGTHRLVSPRETVERVRPLMRRMGITRIANVTHLDCTGIPVVMVVRPNARSVSVSQGKGLDLWAAKASGLMESVESYHAEHITLPLRYGSYAELCQDHCLADVTQLLRCDASLFHNDRPLLWIEAFDLLQDRHTWLPYELVHTDYTLDSTLSPGNFAASSNGVASGNHLLEAISHAICEVVERDATTLWSVMSEAEQQKRRLDLGTVDDPGCCEALEKYARAGIAVGVWETTTDIGLPAFECKIVDRRASWQRNLYAAKGAGCHPARQIALLRALTEAAQSRASYISGSRDDMFRESYERVSAPESTERNRQWSEEGGQRDFHDAPTWEGDTLDEDVAWELKRLRLAGFMSALVVNLTKQEFGLPVVRVVIPGLECKGVIPNCVYGARARASMEGGS